MKQDRRTLQVLFEDKVVGTLGLARNQMVAFEYTDEWIETEKIQKVKICWKSGKKPV